MIGDRLNLSARPNWRARAACRGKPTAWFFPPDRGPYPVTHGWQPPPEALECCKACPVVEECAEAGEREYGVWAGVFHRERGNKNFRGREPEQRVDLSRPRPHVCEGCGHGFLSVQGLGSHRRQCPRRAELEAEVARFEEAIGECVRLFGKFEDSDSSETISA